MVGVSWQNGYESNQYKSFRVLAKGKLTTNSRMHHIKSLQIMIYMSKHSMHARPMVEETLLKKMQLAHICRWHRGSIEKGNMQLRMRTIHLLAIMIICSILLHSKGLALRRKL